MKSLRYTLLGATAGVLTAVNAQAADLPVKAKPVEYVKICSLYGAGFFYIPGTDTCLKVGGYLRSDHVFGDGGNQSAYYLANANARHDRLDTDTYSFRARMNLTVDFRTQSDYGTIRAYAAIIAQNSEGDASGTGVAGILRAFIQFAGFTVGHSVSHFDFFTPGDYTYRPPSVYSGWTGDNGIDLIAYTWKIGNAISASVDIEDGGGNSGMFGTGRGKSVINASIPAQLGTAAAGFTVTTDALHAVQPDLVGNVRLDRSWGSAQVMGAIHNASGDYYNNFPGLPNVAAAPLQTFGHPGEAWGWAVGAGFRLVDFLLPTHNIEAQINYAKGAIGYVMPASGGPTNYNNDFVYGSSNTLGVGYANDGVFVNGSQVELTDAWSASAAYQHYWSPQWRTSVIGGYTRISYGAAARGFMCDSQNAAPATGVFGSFTSAITNCNPDFSLASVSTRTAWNPHPFLEIGLDVIWNHVNTAFSGSTVAVAANGARPAGLYTIVHDDAFPEEHSALISTFVADVADHNPGGRPPGFSVSAVARSAWRVTPKGRHRFSGKIMLQQEARAG